MEIRYHPKVEKVINDLSQSERARIRRVIELFNQNGFAVHQLYLKKLTAEIWEFKAGRYRLLFGIVNGDVMITNTFCKKTQKTPKKEIDLSLKRLKSI